MDHHTQTYQHSLDAMQRYVQQPSEQRTDQIWMLEHPAVFTQGQAGKPEHLLDPHDIPVIQSDRGGQITYHGPGQLIAYLLINLKAKPYGIRELVCRLEKSLIDCLAQAQISAYGKREAPGVYVNEQKIASIGLRVSRGYTYHGLSLNVNMDLTPFQWINPCGYPELQMTQMADYIPGIQVEQIKQPLYTALQAHL